MASLVCGIIGIVFCCLIAPIIGSILAIVFGFVALSHIRQQPQTLRGKGLAVAGLVCGFVGLVLTAIWGIYLLFVWSFMSTETQQIDVTLKEIVDAYNAGDAERCYRLLHEPSQSREDFVRDLNEARQRWGKIREYTASFFKGGYVVLKAEGRVLRARAMYKLTTEKGTAYAMVSLIKEGRNWKATSLEIDAKPKQIGNPWSTDWDD